MRETDHFYSSISPVDDFESLAHVGCYARLPTDWSVVVADVVSSTAAIREGRYKEVNTIGVSVIAAIRNAVRPVDVPYVFGGDGALVLIPGRFADAVRGALGATIAMSKEAFRLELRAAVVPASWLEARGHEILVARHRVSEHYVQSALYQSALFGSGTLHVERALKSGELPTEYLVSEDGGATADYGGLECRWNDIPSPREETVALIVHANGEPGAALDTYRRVMERIREIYGGPGDCRPVREEGLSVSLSNRVLRNELRLRFWKSGLWRRLQEAVRLRVMITLGALFFLFGLRTKETNWGRYKTDLVANTDFRKFDGTLRLVVAGSADQRARLARDLDRMRDQGEISYGIHVARSAIMTCLVEKREGGHFHFVDATDGGYAAAAAQMKAPPAQSTQEYEITWRESASRGSCGGGGLPAS
jgi:hypothetical protein